MPSKPIPAPSKQQLEWQDDQFGIFFHFGINTFHAAEWSDGTLPAESFNPVDFDPDQWAKTAADLGAKYVVLTAKHHDGFCLWPTATTKYSLASSPFQDGQGDIVRDLGNAVRKHGLKFGLYLSPWDRNAPQYPDKDAYDDFYAAQLTELCSNYGELSELWFDGAGSQGREYDWERIAGIIDELQPNAVVFNMGRPTIRWVGNEDGLAADPCEYVVAQTKLEQYTTDSVDLQDAYYLPPECDVSMRRGWFWAESDEPKTVDHLTAIYYRSIGLGANLLLNIPPNNRGLIGDDDLQVLAGFREELQARFSHPIETSVTSNEDGSWTLTFAEPTEIDQLELSEILTDGQRVTGHRVLDGEDVIAEGFTIGNQRVHNFAPRTVSTLRVDVEGEGAAPRYARGFRTGRTVPEVPAGLEATTDAPEAVGAP